MEKINMNRSYFSENASSRPNNPVTGSSWTYLRAFKWLSEKNNASYDLPTEAEWEYVAHDGSENVFPIPILNDTWEGSLDDFAWNIRNSGNSTFPVGMKKPNFKGVYDPMGNVWEWCLDSFVEDEYSSVEETITNPHNLLQLNKKI